VKDFCLNECIREPRFFYWQKQLRHHRREQREQEQASGFVPLVFNTSGTPAKAPVTVSSGHHQVKTDTGCELVYPNGVKLRFPLETDIRKIEQLILLFR